MTSSWVKTWILLFFIALFLAISLGVLFVWLNKQQRRTLAPVTLGLGFVAGVQESGFYDSEIDQDGPFRWTDGNAKLTIPLDAHNHPDALSVSLRVYRPVNIPEIRLRIAANERDLFNNLIPGGPWDATFDLSGFDLGDRLVLQIESDTFQPKGVMEQGENQDPRLLGVQIREIKLIPKQ